MIVVNHERKCKNDSLTDCPWLSLEYYFFNIQKIYYGIPDPESKTTYLDALYLGKLIQIGVIFTLYPITVLFVYLQARLINQLKLRKKEAEASTNLSDYTIMVTRSSPKGLGMNRELLEQYLEVILRQEFPDARFQVSHYYCSTPRTSHQYLNLEIEKVNETIKYVKKRSDEDRDEFSTKEKRKLEKVVKKLEKNKKKLEAQANKQSSLFDLESLQADPPVDQREIFDQTMAFVTLPTIELRNQLIRIQRLKKMRSSVFCRCLNKEDPLFDKWMRLEPGPKFTQISWENASYTSGDRLCKRNTQNTISLVICMAIMDATSEIQAYVLTLFDLKTGTVNKDSFILYFTIIIGVELTYKAGNLALKKIGKMSIGRVKDQFSTINMAYIAVLKFYAFVFSTSLIFAKSGTFNSSFGITEKIFKTLMIDAFLQVILKLLGFTNIIKCLKIFYFSCLKKKRIMVLQKDLNEAFAKPESLIGYLSAFKLHILFLGSTLGFISWLYLLPLLVYLLVSLVGDRFILLKFYAEPNPRDVKVSKSFLYLMWIPIFVSFISIYIASKIYYQNLDPRFDALEKVVRILGIGNFVLAFLSVAILGFFMLFFEGRAGLKGSGDEDERYSSMEVTGQDFDVSLTEPKAVEFAAFYEDALKR